MDFMGGLPLTKRGYDYLFIIVDGFDKMYILIPCKNNIIGKVVENLFFSHVWVHFGLPSSILSNKDS